MGNEVGLEDDKCKTEEARNGAEDLKTREVNHSGQRKRKDRRHHSRAEDNLACGFETAVVIDQAATVEVCFGF